MVLSPLVFLMNLKDLGISSRVRAGVCKKGSGTTYYMAPERFTPSREHSYPSDWWSYGVMAHELLTGRIPFKAGAFNNSRDIEVDEKELEKVYEGGGKKIAPRNPSCSALCLPTCDYVLFVGINFTGCPGLPHTSPLFQMPTHGKQNEQLRHQARQQKVCPGT